MIRGKQPYSTPNVPRLLRKAGGRPNMFQNRNSKHSDVKNALRGDGDQDDQKVGLQVVTIDSGIQIECPIGAFEK